MESFLTKRSEILRYVASIDVHSYAKLRNYVGHSTKLSPYITRGLVTLTEVRDTLLADHSEHDLQPLIFELAWREYWQREWHYRGDTIFSDIKRQQEPVDSVHLPAAIISKHTGVTALDSALQKLESTGYIHNHERLWIAGLICNTAHTHWWEPSLWMHYHLLDGDPASNSLSWQWVAGTFSSKKYLASQSNINQYTQHKQQGTIIDYDYDTLATMAIPQVLRQRSKLNLSWTAPTSDTFDLDSKTPVHLYHSFWLNSAWRSDEDAQRILLLEPSWFKKFSVSPQVTNYILACAQEIPGIKIVVADFNDIKWPKQLHYVDHPSVKHWKGTPDAIPKLFPHVKDRSFNSFMAFWKACTKK